MRRFRAGQNRAAHGTYCQCAGDILGLGQHSTAQHSTSQSSGLHAVDDMSLSRRHRLGSNDEPCQYSCAHFAQHPTQHRTAHAVGLVQIQLVGACITEPLPPGDTSYPVALLVHGHITVCAITQQDLIPAGNQPTICSDKQLGMTEVKSLVLW